MKNKNPLKLTLAILIIVTGALGLFLPIIPGIALIVIGLFMLNPKWKSKFKDWLKRNRYK